MTKNLNNLRVLRAYARDISLAELEEVVDKFQLVLEEKREAEKASIERERARQERIAQYREQLQNDGISLDELLGGTTPARSRAKRGPMPAKYQYVDENGERQTWSGQGRKPRVIQAALAAGQSLDDFKI